MILKGWSHRLPQEKAELRGFLLDMLQKRSRNLQPFVLNKAVKVLVDVAKHDWPAEFPDLFPAIQQMTQTDLVQVGLLLLKTVCEEFASTRDDVSAMRRAQLGTVKFEKKIKWKLFLNFFFSFLSFFLLSPLALDATSSRDSIFGFHDPGCAIWEAAYSGFLSSTFSVTKPHINLLVRMSSSQLNLQGPSQSPSGFGSPAGGGMRSRSSSQHRTFGSTLGVSAGYEVEKFVNTRNLDGANKQICSLCLEVLLQVWKEEETGNCGGQNVDFFLSFLSFSSSFSPQLFSWIPLSSHINQRLLTTIFHFAALNDDTAVNLGVLAMSCVNEMLGKSCVPQEFEEYLLLIFQFVSFYQEKDPPQRQHHDTINLNKCQ